MPSRIGLFGGTFDPPHLGHVAAALEVSWACGLDAMYWVPAGDPWQKRGDRAITSGGIRVEMVEAAVADLDAMDVLDLEVTRSGPSYTVDTLRALTEPGRRIEVVLGADAAIRVPTWHRAEEVAELAELVVVDRGDTDRSDVDTALGGAWPHRWVTMPRLDISSTDIRSRVAERRPIRGLVPAAVCSVIESHGIYGDER